MLGRLFQGPGLDHLQELKGPTGHNVHQANVSPEEPVDTMGLSSRVPLYCLCAIYSDSSKPCLTAVKVMLEEHRKIVNLSNLSTSLSKICLGEKQK